jgi:hypothetical protein
MSYNKVTAASNYLPLPCKDEATGLLTSIKNLKINTRLGSERFLGELYRNYPPFSMTGHFLEMLEYASDTVDNPGASPLLALIGEAGIGKTSSAELAGYLVDGVTPETFACGGRSLDDLLFEPIFNDVARSKTSILQERFNKGEVNPLSVHLLKNQIPEMIVENPDGSTSLDVNKVTPERVVHAHKIIQEVCDQENIGASGGIGISYKEGALIRIWKSALQAEKEGKPYPCRLIIDEIDKRLPNTGKSLQQVWLVLQGLKESETVDKNGVSFTFSRQEMPRSFSVVITGNDNRDLGEGLGLSQSMLSRMSIISVDKATEEDLANRICQILCKMNLLYLENLPQDNKSKSRLNLELRRLGTDEHITEEQAWLLKNYEKTIQASRQLASFYIKWGELVDPRNELIDDPILEATSSFREPPGVRKAITDLLRAIRNKVQKSDPTPAVHVDNPLEAHLAQADSPDEETPSLGERIEKVILSSIQKSTGGPATKAKLLMLAKTEGLIPDPDEEENPNQDRKLIRDLLSTKEEAFTIKEETKALQKELYDGFIRANKGTLGKNPPSADALLPLRDLQFALDELKGLKEEKTTDEVTYILNMNPNYITGKKSEKPVECIPVLDVNAHQAEITAIQKNEGKEGLYDYMIETSTLVSLLQTPVIGKDTLNAFWSRAWKNAINEVRTEDGVDFGEMADFLKMNDGTHERMRVVKVITKNKDGRPEPLVILDSPTGKATWVVLNESGYKKPVQSIPRTLADGKKTGETLYIVSKEGIPEMLKDVQKAVKDGAGSEYTDIAEAINMLNKNGSPKASSEPEIAISDAIDTSKGINSRGSKLPLRTSLDKKSKEKDKEKEEAGKEM